MDFFAQQARVRGSSRRLVALFVLAVIAIVLTIDPVLIRQALFNLIHNAILVAPRAKVQVVLARVERNRVPGVQVSVTDSGPGFAP